MLLKNFKKINKKLNKQNIECYLLFLLQKKYLLNINFYFLYNLKKGNIVFIEIFNYEFYNYRKYFFLGLCIAIKKNIISTRFILRNVLGHILIDQQFLVFNNLILNIRNSKKRAMDAGKKKSKLFFLKNLPFFFRINKLVINETFYYLSKKIKKLKNNKK